ncbi:6585_t:CDS:2 [Scutellospora calospora]|uniref:6585_t:CDS:1 n=1 Tax=Scutellospora calospora TaxID=85575 RepID=A0ACA9K0V1_9GLOM|nr:6585_t:CDS:2 [Scutellospora calospora]
MKNLIVILAFLIVFAYADTHQRNLIVDINDQILIKTFTETFTTDSIQDCGKPEDILHITYLDIAPDPPQRGQELSIDAAGYLTETVVEGSYIELTVKMGLIRLLQKKLDLCEQVEKVNKECPLEKGEQTLQHTVELPKEIPPGKYTVDVHVYTPDRRPIACLKATAFFRP